MKKYRNNGAIGGLLDEYEKALLELQVVTRNISPEELTAVVDTETKDPDCSSVQAVLSHVVQSGYTYVVEIRKWLGEDEDYRTNIKLDTVNSYILAMQEMFKFNERLFQDHPDINLETYDLNKKIKVRWGQTYDVEQLLEHAIVHILRHRRQVERFLLKLRELS